MEEFKIKDGVLIKYYGNEKNVIIPDGVRGIRDKAFKNCRKITSIVIPGSVKNIRFQAFYNCGNLTNVNIDFGLEHICRFRIYGMLKTKAY